MNMIKNSNGSLIYLQVPAKYEYVYKELLYKLAEYTSEITNDCKCNCVGFDKQLLQCWYIFQSACAAYTIGRYKQADLMIKYIMSQCSIKDTIITIMPNYIYYGFTDVNPNDFKNITIESLFNNETVHFKDLIVSCEDFTITQEKSIHYLLIPSNYMELVSAEYGTAAITTLFDINEPDKGVYSLTHPGGEYEGIYYKVFFYYSPIGAFTDKIRIVVKNK